MNSNYSAGLALLSGTIDYAGMFPPAKLSFHDTLQRAALWRTKKNCPWLLGRVVLPIAEFMKITNRLLFESGADGSPWLFTVLASPGDPWLAAQQDLSRLSLFNDTEQAGALHKQVKGYEWKAPDDSNLADGWKKTLTTLNITSLQNLTVFVEMPMANEALQRIELLTSVNASVSFGLKVRTGGASVPTPEQLALAIDSAAKHQLKFKATQGLHDAISHHGSFGFVNLFAALALRYHDDVKRETLAECLKDENAKSFTFTDESFSWRGHTLNLSDIETGRQKHGGAFGSCSLDEPMESLKKTYGEFL